jgi:hypothetical protein
MKKWDFILANIVLFFIIFIVVNVSWAVEKPKWLVDLEKFAKEKGNSGLLEKVRLFSTPEAIKIQKEWKDFLGFDAPSIIEKVKDKYPDIKPGVVINGDNYKQFPSLKKLLPESIYRRLPKGSYAQIGEIKIVPTSSYYLYREILGATKANLNKSKIGPNNELLNWKGGVPFPFPKNGAQVYHNRDRFDVPGDALYFNPSSFTMFDRKGKRERVEKGEIYWMYYKGRTKLAPKPDIPGYDNVLEKGSLRMTYPYDLNGIAIVRTKFLESLKKPDDFVSYIPALRRIRRLAGTDTMDPIIGTDIAWEDWRGWWQNIITWPTEFKLVGEGVVLLPSMPHKFFYKVDEKGKFHDNWELRPCFVLEAVTKNKNYFYNKRRVWVDKEFFMGIHYEMYDIRNNLWKSLMPIRAAYPDGEIHWLFGDMVDYVNKHRSLMRMQSIMNDPKITNDYFELKFLIRMAH